MQTTTATAIATVITPAELLQHWQGLRRLSRRVIDAFPEQELLSFSIGGMRPFAALAQEMIDLAANGLRGIVTGQWSALDEHHSAGAGPATSKEELLRRWDDATAVIEELWPRLSLERFHETVLAFGQYEGSVYSTFLYFIDNENHHRGQGYVYLRALGIAPPAFWDRE